MTAADPTADTTGTGPAARDRTMLLVGGTDQHLERAKALGVRVVLIQHPDKINAFQTGLADALLMVDYTDWATVRPLAEAAREVWGFDAVVSLTEGGLDTAARLREHFGFPGTRPEVSRRLRDKHLMRRHLAEHGTSAMHWGRVTDRASLEDFGGRAGFPFIVKPTDATASFGLIRVAGAGDLDAVWERIEELRGRRTDRGSTLFTVREFLMESYLDGPEFSVEAFSFGGRHVVVAVTEKLVDDTHFAELGHALPARLAPDAHARVTAAVAEFLDTMGVSDGPSHTELRLGSRGPVVIESHNRVGGGHINELVEAAYGIDLIAYGVAWPMGLVEELAGPPAARAGACTRFVLRDPGTVTAVSGVAEVAARADVLAVEVSVRPGDTVRPLRDNWDRLGFAAVTAADTDAAIALCERLTGGIRIDVTAHENTAPAADHGIAADPHDDDMEVAA
ncbi:MULTISPECIES: ATP-grasp domain-containing protein [unclassified Streptomyces]|uniref:ATP-grasp domain-containing protein n=1 Tax=unclassified Streptomyces TaxID=2593676 RepID=UPI000DC7EBF8|nr:MULTISPECIES: ATP-grasp domain-containing protein [unclassified Streptomyces]AWZ05908.1 carboxylase [Streptomyces sp. ICC4]AWZ11956.1 carboxylase [Streptomyces sp. ICC1]